MIVICPKCKNNNLKSKVYYDYESHKDKYDLQHWNEVGMLVYRVSPNVMFFKCSNGHKFVKE